MLRLVTLLPCFPILKRRGPALVCIATKCARNIRIKKRLWKRRVRLVGLDSWSLLDLFLLQNSSDCNLIDHYKPNNIARLTFYMISRIGKRIDAFRNTAITPAFSVNNVNRKLKITENKNSQRYIIRSTLLRSNIYVFPVLRRLRNSPPNKKL